jgi:hypothetical protein
MVVVANSRTCGKGNSMITRKNHMWMLLAIALCAVAGGLFTLYQTYSRRYAAVAWIRFDEERPYIVGLSPAPPAVKDMGTKQTGLEAIDEGIKRIIRKGKSLDDPLVRDAMLRVFGEDCDGRRELEKSITMSAVGESALVTVRWETGDTRRVDDCAAIIDAVVRECVDMMTAEERRELNHELSPNPDAETDVPPRVTVIRFAGAF